MVTICCTTYNHEKTIAKTIDGFLMQKTNFKYNIIIHDDCSTDKTTEILAQYKNKHPELVVIFQKENQFQFGRYPHIVFFSKYIKTKYVVMCEGDDWWIDENKLQLQVNLLESNPTLTGCWHLAELRDATTNDFISYNINHKKFSKKNIFKLEDNFFSMTTCTLMFRFDIFKKTIIKLYPSQDHGIINGDTWQICFFLLNGNIGYINQAMSVRTINGNSIWLGKNVTEDSRNIRFAKEIINFPLEMEKLFTIYGKTSPFSFIEAYEKVINSAIKYNKPDLINSINNDFFIQYFKTKEKIHTHQINKIKQKYKKI